MSNNALKMTVYPATEHGEPRPIILVLHGTAGLAPPFGPQIQNFASSLAEQGYVTAVPQYDPGNAGALGQSLSDAIAKVATRKDADSDRLGLVGYSLGAAVAMTYINFNSPGRFKVLVDFFGPILDETTIKGAIAKFPPTIIFHNKNDDEVPFENSKKLLGLLGAIKHRLVVYEELSPKYHHHPFKQGGHPDVDSRKQATEWVLEHLPPTGR
jgi:carboxymethylenebutenolidase